VTIYVASDPPSRDRWLTACPCAVLFPRHIQAKDAQKTIDLIHTFRDYLHYHIKCSKAYLHQRMRARTADLLKVRAANRRTRTCRSQAVAPSNLP